MKHNQIDRSIVSYLTIGAILAISLLILWDCGTSTTMDIITINPFKTDFSWKNFDVNSFIQSLLSAFLGFSLTIIFVEILLRRSREKEKEYLRNVQLNNIVKLLCVPVMRYKHAIKDLLNDKNDDVLNKDVDFHSLAGMFDGSSLMNSLLRPKIAVYSEALNHLTQTIKLIALNADLSKHTEIAELISDFLVFEDACNPCSTLLNYQNLVADGKRYSDTLKNDILSYNNKIEQIGFTHVLTPVVRLKGFIEHTNAFLIKLYHILPQMQFAEPELLTVLQRIKKNV